MNALNNSESYLAKYESYHGLCCWTVFFYCLSYLTPITIAVLFPSESKSSGFHANESLNNSESYLANYKSYHGLCCWTDLLHCLFHAMSYLYYFYRSRVSEKTVFLLFSEIVKAAI